MLGSTLVHLLPLLVVLAVVGLLVLVCRRLFDAIPIPLALAGLALVALLFGPALWRGEVLLPADQLRFAAPFQGLVEAPRRPTNPLQVDVLTRVIPALTQARSAILRGEWPLWNPAVGAGESLLGNPSTQVLQPLQWAALLVPVAQSTAVTAALRVLGALLFTYLYLRRLGVGHPAAALGSGAWALSAFTQLWLLWPVANVAVWLPMGLWAIVLAARERRPRDLALLALAVFGLATSGAGQVAGYALVLFTAVAVAEVLLEPPAERARRLLPSLLVALAGLAVAAPVLLASADFRRDTLDQFNLEARVSLAEERDPLGLLAVASSAGRERWISDWVTRAIPSLAPDALGNSRAGRYWGASNSNEDGSGFAGTLVWLLALLAMARSLRRGAETFAHERLMAATVAIAAVIVARPPVIVTLLEHLPLLGASSTYHQRAMALLGFATCMLAACSLDRWAGGSGAGGRTRLATVTLAASLAGLIAWAYLAHPAPADSHSLSALRQRSLAVQLAVVVVAGSLLAVPGRRRAVLWGLPALGLAELLSFHQPVNRSVPRQDFPPTPSLVSYLKRQTAPGERMIGLSGALPQELAAMYGLADARFAGGEHPVFYERLTRPLTRKARQNRPGTFALADHPVLDLLAVRHVVTPPDTRLPLKLMRGNASGRVYARDRPLSLLFFPMSTVSYRAELGPWEEWTAANPDFSAITLVRGKAPDGEERWQATDSTPPRVAIEPLAADRIRAQVQLEERRLLATSVFQDSGWRLLVNGRQATTTIANGPLLAAWVEPGALQVDLVYRPRALLWGGLLAALGLAACGAITLRATARRSRWIA